MEFKHFRYIKFIYLYEVIQFSVEKQWYWETKLSEGKKSQLLKCKCQIQLSHYHISIVVDEKSYMTFVYRFCS